MLRSLGFILLLGFLFKKLFERFNLPGLLGMVVLGVLIGPYNLNLIDGELMNISKDLRSLALMVILLRAGLGINKNDLRKVGFATIKMSFIPGILEGLSIGFISNKLLGLSVAEAGMLGFILAAVSPAVIVPSMLDLINKGLGCKKGIPTLIVTSASIDDVVAITIFGIFLDMYFSTSQSLGLSLVNIPIAIILGLGLGFLTSIFLTFLLKKKDLSSLETSLLILGLSLVISSINNIGYLKLANLLSIMGLGFFIREKNPRLTQNLSQVFNGMWEFFQIFLFVLIGGEVNPGLALESGFIPLGIILFGLVFRSIGVVISIRGLGYNIKEKIFCIISYLPKATVQAAIGGVPLAMGVEYGSLILNISVLAIVVTAPLGSILINYLAPRLLSLDKKKTT